MQLAEIERLAKSKAVDTGKDQWVLVNEKETAYSIQDANTEIPNGWRVCSTMYSGFNLLGPLFRR